MTTQEHTATSADLAYARLRDAIVRGELVAGEHVSQVQLAADLEISRTPLREAIRRLETEGLVAAESHRRIRVTALSFRDLDQVYGQRLLLEPLAVRLSVPRLTRADIDALERARDLSTEALRAEQVDEFHHHHRELHLGLVKGVGRRLFNDIAALWGHAERYHRAYLVDQGSGDHRERSIAEHFELVEAANSRDGDACAQILFKHLSVTALNIFNYHGGPDRPEMINLVLKTHGTV